MKGKYLVSILVALAAFFTVLTVAAMSYKDTKPPVISYEKEVIHLAGTDVNRLLEDVRAEDNEEGDVTGSLIIAGIYQVSDDTGIVVYAAKDASNNIATSRRRFTYEAENRDEIFAETGNVPDQSEASPNGDSSSGGSDSQKPGGDVSNPGGQENNPAQADLNGNLSDEEYARLKKENLEKGYPIIRLKVHEVTLHVGDQFKIYTYIAEVEDDVDTINTMLRLEHNVDTSKPGVYQAEVYARDSDGHASNTERLKVTVIE